MIYEYTMVSVLMSLSVIQYCQNARKKKIFLYNLEYKTTFLFVKCLHLALFFFVFINIEVNILTVDGEIIIRTIYFHGFRKM